MSVYEALLGDHARLAKSKSPHTYGLTAVCGLAADCEARPAHLTTYLILADALDELGTADKTAPAVAFALRWCHASARRPGFRTDVAREPWTWVRETPRPTKLAYTLARAFPAAVIPAEVWRGPEPFDCREHWGQSVLFLANLLAPLRRALLLARCDPSPEAK